MPLDPDSERLVRREVEAGRRLIEARYQAAVKGEPESIDRETAFAELKRDHEEFLKRQS